MKLYEFFNVPIDPLKAPDPEFKHISPEEKQKIGDELYWFILDQDALHKEYAIPLIKDLKNQLTSPEFNKKKFSKAWMPMVNKGCSLFYKKEKLKKDPKQLFDDELKNEICEKLTDQIIDGIDGNAYHIGDHKL